MEICVVGTGYVGLVTGACLAEMGNTVICVDVDAEKIEGLKKGIVPIYEPGLDKVVFTNYSGGRLRFSTDLPSAMELAEIVFIAVGTPPGEDGSADLTHVLAVARQVGQCLQRYLVVVDKSTVPVGTAEKVKQAILKELKQRDVQIDFDVVSNPEFLKEGAAVNDFMSPDRIVIGADTVRAREKMAELYAPFVRNHPRTVYMAVRDAEMTKYAANAMLATKISFMNEIAEICEHLDVDVENVRLGIGSDQRIGFHFIYPGAGYGGSCFPKDVKALIKMAHSNKFDPELLRAVESRNEIQKGRLFKKILAHFDGELAGRRIAIWGLAFKPGTDDMREAPSKALIDALIAAGATIRAFDPVAHDTAKKNFKEEFFEEGKLVLCDTQYDALDEAHALVLVTEWKLFRHPDFSLMQQRMREKVIFDGRNQFNPSLMKQLGFIYQGIGRKS